ncbi:MAG: enoyl-CoA hydratase/isomerase family protein [Chloroflexi bacterium]|nr:enoyl-CoA hydratase/isomerase family protein [Chloroflexota bacterium]
MSDDYFLVDEKGYIATFIINRPEKRNALNPEIHAGLVSSIDRMADEGKIRCLVIRGQGDMAFSAGDDLKRDYSASGPSLDEDKDPSMQWPRRTSRDAIFDAPFPVVAMIQGFCVGGGLALATECDMRIAAEGSSLGIPPSRLGIIYDFERIQVFVDLIGPSFTKELFCSGRRVDARRALDMGLVNEVVGPDDLEAAVYGLAEEFATAAPLSLKGHKRIVNTLVSRRVEGSALSAADIEEMRQAHRQAQQSAQHQLVADRHHQPARRDRHTSSEVDERRNQRRALTHHRHRNPVPAWPCLFRQERHRPFGLDQVGRRRLGRANESCR